MKLVGKMVTIRYQLKGLDSPREVSIPDEEYYDPLEKGESYLVEGIAKHQEPHIYLAKDPSELDWLVLIEPLDYQSKIFRYQYLDGLDSFMVHTVWPNGDEEIIHSTSISKKETLITRTSKESGKSWATVACGKVNRDESYSDFTGDKGLCELLSFQGIEC